MPRKKINGKPAREILEPKRNILKKKLMEALTISLGNISASCESLGISRNEYYKFYDKDEEFRKHAETCKERRLDFAESKLDRLIAQENPAAIFFILKTLGKNRGYSERHEIESKEQINIIWEESRDT